MLSSKKQSAGYSPRGEGAGCFLLGSTFVLPEPSPASSSHYPGEQSSVQLNPKLLLPKFEKQKLKFQLIIYRNQTLFLKIFYFWAKLKAQTPIS